MSRSLAALAALGGGALLLYRWRRARRGPSVLVASRAAVKLAAARAAFEASSVVGIAAPSGISDQPIGPEQTLAGARNRMAAARLDDAASRADFLVACENGLVRVESAPDAAERWLDICLVIVHEKSSGLEAVASSAGVEFPPSAVAEWAEAGDEGTVGALLAASSGCDAQDPHAHLTRGRFPRAALLESAIRIARASLEHQKAPGAS